MFENDCHDCSKLSSVIEEKEKKINSYEKNLLDVKSRMLESGNLITIYLNYKSENENLKRELDNMRQNIENNLSNSQFFYEVN
jgi:hypothetical protein